ncbi:hypothetical protein PHYBOEH_006491 [Phytophthora boehmeriae]|uniref:Uncharacterized protein n=1 Tax=Phytophthora boehmeriae TaxID=109152 RepID=A0A8T1WJ28_9STRA|nr:hypothetical protein PHYBOEH_006491 [Phytophthora boehmeriae]
MVAEAYDLREWLFMEWIYHLDDCKWKQYRQHVSYALPPVHLLPEPKTNCENCDTEIRYNFLAKHRTEPDKYIVIGSVCVLKTDPDFLKKKCVRCGKCHRKHTPMCGKCREEQQLYEAQQYREAQRARQLHEEQQYLEEQRYREARRAWLEQQYHAENRLSFGKYCGTRVDDLIGKDDSYLRWLVACDSLDEELKQHLVQHVLKLTAMPFGKYKGTRICDIKDSSYLQWIRSKVSDSWAQHV